MTVKPKEPDRNPAIARALPTQNSIESQPVRRAAGVDGAGAVAVTASVLLGLMADEVIVRPLEDTDNTFQE